LKLFTNAAEVTVTGRSFQMRAAATPKARSSTVWSLVLGTTSRWPDDQRRRWRGVSLCQLVWIMA